MTAHFTPSFFELPSLFTLKPTNLLFLFSTAAARGRDEGRHAPGQGVVARLRRCKPGGRHAVGRARCECVRRKKKKAGKDISVCARGSGIRQVLSKHYSLPSLSSIPSSLFTLPHTASFTTTFTTSILSSHSHFSPLPHRLSLTGLSSWRCSCGTSHPACLTASSAAASA